MKMAHQFEAGDSFEPLVFTVSPELNQQILLAQEDFNKRYLPAEMGGGNLVHPTLVVQMLTLNKSPGHVLPQHVGAIMSESETQYLSPPVVGKTYRTTYTVDKIYEKRGKIYHQILSEITDASGIPMARRKLQITYIESNA